MQAGNACLVALDFSLPYSILSLSTIVPSKLITIAKYNVYYSGFAAL